MKRIYQKPETVCLKYELEKGASGYLCVDLGSEPAGETLTNKRGGQEKISNDKNVEWGSLW